MAAEAPHSSTMLAQELEAFGVSPIEPARQPYDLPVRGAL